MNRTERKRIERIRKILAAVPLPHNGKGGKTASSWGAIAYSEDMRTVLPLINEAILSLTTGLPEYDAELALTNAEAYITQRAREQWATR
jgi:CRISPR/Cas system CSM-associated protein Csm4 (group 5 of RAMP superfamily)